MLWIWLWDVFSFLGFYAGLPEGVLLPALLAGAVMLPVLRLLIRRRPWQKERLSKGDLVVIAYFCLFTAGKTLFPDMCEDSCRHHVFLQTPYWKDMISFHLIPAGIQGFTFPLVDRLFYLFRVLLGYRMGTVLNLLCMSLTYIQARRIMKKICGIRYEKLHPFLCFLAVTQYDAVAQAGTYMVEIIGTTLVLEGIWFLLREPENKNEILVFAGLQGLLFALKMTNVVYVAPLVVLYVFKNRKQITVPLFGICVLAGAVPLSIYLIHNWIQAGNPIYPYYNKVFGSPYYPDSNFKDVRWGGSTWKEVILWPFIGIIKPGYHQSELPIPYTWGYGSAWLFLLIFCAGRFLKRCQKGVGLGYMTVLVILCTLFWSASTGHVRYYLPGFVILMLSGICAGICFISGKRTTDLLVMFLLAVMIPGPFVAIQTCVAGGEWSFRPGLSNRILPGGIPRGLENLGLYKEQLKVVGRDRKIGTPEQRQRPEKLVLTGSDSVFTTLLNPRIPVVRWSSVKDSLRDELFEACCLEMEKELEESDGIYGIIRVEKGSQPEIDNYMWYGFAVKSAELLPQNIFLNKDLFLVRLKNPKDPLNKLNRERAIGLLGTEEIPVAQVRPGKDVTFWIETPGLETAPGLSGESPWMATLQILRECGEERQIVEERELDLRQQNVYEIKLDFAEEKEKVFLYAVLRLPEADSGRNVYARAWIRTSITGRQEFYDDVYYIDESGFWGRGLVEDEEGRYYADAYGRVYSGWKRVDGKWYYFSEDGSMYTGWLDGEYYLGEDGVMVTGIQVIDGVTYEFDDSGALRSGNP